MKKHWWFWVLLFVLFVIIVVILGTYWNLVIYGQYEQFMEIAKSASFQKLKALGLEKTLSASKPWLALISGSLGFVALMGVTLLIFVRLFHEMRLNQLQSEFLAKVGHELKTPIATMELSSSLLRRENLATGEREKLWSSHTEELSRLKNEVSDLLRAARWESRAPKPELKVVNLEQWILESTELWKKILGPEFELNRTGEKLDFFVKIDPNLMSLVAVNLVGNAKKFSNGVTKLSINTSSQLPDGIKKWILEFRDYGIGFSPKMAKKVFGRFYQNKITSNRAIPGTGLGLFLAKKAAKAQKLKLWAESEGEGKGARFYISGAIL